MSFFVKSKRSAAAGVLAALVAPAFLAAAPAQAQLAQNSHAPVDMTADELEVVNAQCLAIWRGSVEALQDNARLRADVLKIYNKPGSATRTSSGGSSCGTLDRMEASGSVYYVTPTQRVRGDNAVYQADADTITFTGDVVATQGKNVLRGERLVIQVATGQAQMETSVKGRNKPGRVRGVFYPNDKTQDQPAAPK
ncbi:LptA/OstA family protein [Phenylobacterium sp.]|uniref:LptA/OstA family protein n=1 Tax=Phenylobacterium sp. TaxID=1871053 RepID=UPI0035AE22F9